MKSDSKDSKHPNLSQEPTRIINIENMLLKALETKIGRPLTQSERTRILNRASESSTPTPSISSPPPPPIYVCESPDSEFYEHELLQIINNSLRTYNCFILEENLKKKVSFYADFKAEHKHLLSIANRPRYKELAYRAIKAYNDLSEWHTLPTQIAAYLIAPDGLDLYEIGHLEIRSYIIDFRLKWEGRLSQYKGKESMINRRQIIARKIEEMLLLLKAYPDTIIFLQHYQKDNEKELINLISSKSKNE